MSNKMSIFPNSLTMGNMFFGFLSIVASIKGNYEWACYFIIFGGVCDMLDGKVARLVKCSSDFGVEFDSLSDLITFGAAPSILLYSIYSTVYTASAGMKDMSHFFIVFSFLPMLFTGIRLARFNAELVGHDKEAFSGLPSPASAMTIIAFVLFELEVYGKLSHLKWLTMTTLIVSYLMISRIKYHGFPVFFKKGERYYLRYFKLAIVALVILAVVKFKMSLLFPMMALFILFGVVMSMIEKFKKDSEISDNEADGDN